jgi:hypothetical protein
MENIDDTEAKARRRAYASRAVLIFVALVMYFHGVYGLLSICNDYTLPVAMGLWIFAVAAAILSIEDTLANIMAFSVGEEQSEKGFLCGILDRDLKTCFGYRCFVYIGCNRRLYISRLLYYNMNAFLVAAAWWGVDIVRAYVVEKATAYSLGPRIGVDLLYLFIANLVLLMSDQVLGQFGVVGDKSALHPVDESAETVGEYSGSAGNNLGSSLQISLLGATKQSPRTSFTGRVIKEFKTVVIFLGLTMFWTAIWDLFGSIPAESLVSSDDDGDDDYYDRHIAGSREDEFRLFILGLAYAVISLSYLLITGELFALLKKQDTNSEEV